MRDLRSGVSFIFHFLLGQQIFLSQGFYLRRATLAWETKTQADIHFSIGGLLTKQVTVTRMWRRSTESILAYQRRISCHLWVTVSQQVSAFSLSPSLRACSLAEPSIWSASLGVLLLLLLASAHRKWIQPAMLHFSHIQCFGWQFASNFLQFEVPGL